MPGLLNTLLGKVVTLLDDYHNTQGGVSYLMQQAFGTDEAAPIASPHTETGQITLVQNDGQFSISGGKLVFPAQTTPNWGDLGWYSDAFDRVTGRAFLHIVNRTSGGESFVLRLAQTQANLAFAYTGQSYYLSGSEFFAQANTSLSRRESISAGVDYQFALILRSAGAFACIQGGAFAEWTLIYPFAVATYTPVYAQFNNYQLVGNMDRAAVSDLSGVWTDDYGIATQRVSGSVSALQAFTHEANGILEFVVTTRPSAGNMDVSFRQQDATHRWIIRVSSTGALSLIEDNAGETVRATSAGVVANGDRIVATFDGTTIKVSEGDVQRLSYTSAANFQTDTDGEVLSLGTGGAISNLVTYPRTLSGQALAALSAIGNPT